MLGLLGLTVLCIIPFLSVNGEALSAIDGHPGLFALLVTVATALVLVFGLPSFIEKLAISKSLERIGKYSYSIYLVHFPIIVIYLSTPFGGTNLSISTFQDGVIILVSIILASMLLYYFVESNKFKYSVKALVAGSSVSLILLTMLLPLIQSKVTSKDERLIFGAFSDRSTYRCGKIIRVLEPTAISCDLTPEIDNPKQKLILVGNSHSDSIKSSFVDALEVFQAKLYFMVPNNPLMKGAVNAKVVVDDAISKGVDKLVLHYSSSSISNETITNIISLSKQAGIRVYFIEPVPTWEENIPNAMYQQLLHEGYKVKSKTKLDYFNDNSMQLNFVRSIENENFTTLSVVEYFCNSNCIYSTIEGKPLYFDSNHLTLTGSKKLNEVFNNILLD